LRRWAASIRQVVETVYDKLHNIFGLRRERPHDDLAGLRARLAARVALHNFCIWLNENTSAVPGWLSPTCWDGDLNSHQVFNSLGQTFVIVTHDPGVGSLMDRVVRMEDGRIVE
jgi:ABC-type lipoprotein export system ATPase subunit